MKIELAEQRGGSWLLRAEDGERLVVPSLAEAMRTAEARLRQVSPRARLAIEWLDGLRIETNERGVFTEVAHGDEDAGTVAEAWADAAA